MRNNLLLLCSLILILTSTDVKAQKRTKKAERQRIAQAEIRTLRDGILFVEILDDSYLAQVAAVEMRDRLKERIKQHEDHVRAAFEAHYTFSDIRFFKSSDYIKPSSRSSNQADYLNPDSEIAQANQANQPFLIASFSTTTSYNEIPFIRPDEEAANQAQDAAQYREYEKPKSGIFLANENWGKIEKPFPFYTRVRTIFLTEEEIGIAVMKLNKSLVLYYNKVN